PLPGVPPFLEAASHRVLWTWLRPGIRGFTSRRFRRSFHRLGFRVFYHPQRGRGMLKTWEKTCCGASIIVPNLDFSCWTGPSGRLLRAGAALRDERTASGRASAASGGGEVGGSGR